MRTDLIDRLIVDEVVLCYICTHCRVVDVGMDSTLKHTIGLRSVT